MIILLQISQAPQKLVGLDGLNLFSGRRLLLKLVYTSFCEHVGLCAGPHVESVASLERERVSHDRHHS